MQTQTLNELQEQRKEGADGAAPAAPQRFTDPWKFRLAVEREATRHGRHLQGFGIAILSLDADAVGEAVFRSIVATETRRTDLVSMPGQGIVQILAPHASDHGLECLVHRLARITVTEARDRSERPVRIFAGLATSDHRRPDADTMWNQAKAALKKAREGGAFLAFDDDED